jgi:hypothetical protein
LTSPGALVAAANASHTDGGAWGWEVNACELELPYICKMVPLGGFVFASDTSLATYVFNTTPSSFNQAQEACNHAGGHLAYFDSAAEQAEVEQEFTSGGQFIPSYHR